MSKLTGTFHGRKYYPKVPVPHRFVQKLYCNLLTAVAIIRG